MARISRVVVPEYPHHITLVKDQTLRGLIRDWKDFLLEANASKDETIRKMTRTGRPVGGVGFVSLVEHFYGSRSFKRKAGTAV